MRHARLCPIALVGLLGTLIAAGPLGSWAEESPSEGEPVAIGTYRILRSSVLGEDRVLLASVPRDYESTSMSYPVLFVLYGDQVRGYFAEAVNVVDRLSEEGSIPGLIVVGVANTDRYRDLSPVGRQGSPSGIEPFLGFVAGELIPYVEREYRTKNYRILVGPQAGAEFGLYSLAHYPDLFDALILGNPLRSKLVRDQLHGAMVSLTEKGFASPKFVHIACPDTEGGVGKAEEVAYMRDLEKELAAASVSNLRLVVRYIEGNRDFVPSLLLTEGLRQLFRDYPFPEDREVRGLEDVAEHYSALSEQLGFDVDIPERVLALKADALRATGAIDAATEMLKYLVSAYPVSLDGYWRLANLCREQGDRQMALKYYRRCLEIMPTMRPASDWIIRLERGE